MPTLEKPGGMTRICYTADGERHLARDSKPLCGSASPVERRTLTLDLRAICPQCEEAAQDE